MSTLAPWLQAQLDSLRHQRSHALLLAGPAGLGQYELALALARTWLCEQPTALGACGVCPSCHAIDVRTHPDLLALLPETLAIERNWPLDPKTQDKIDKKELKPSRHIRVDATREAVAFTQYTRSRGHTKVVMIYPADRLNMESANTLLKTLEEPPGAVRFVLATEAAHALPATVRSRCVTHHMVWPTQAEGLAWLKAQAERQGADGKFAAPAPSALETWWRASGGRPDEAWEHLQQGLPAQVWADLPRALARGDFSPMAQWPVARQMDALLKLCHDLMALRAGAPPRFFEAAHLPPPPAWPALAQWHRDLQQAHRTMEHPYNAGLLQEAWAARTQAALALH
jgi:DNA polymerase III subunit delta'